MNILKLFESFQTQEQAVEYLEKVRWRGQPSCPYCKSQSVGTHASGDRAIHRWQCRDCTRAFSVTVGTIFHGTHVPLRNWFLVLALMLNANKSASAYQIARDLGMRRPTVWSMMHRVRVAMEADQYQSELLHGIVEADEAYIGGKPRRPNIGSGPRGKGDNKRGRGTSKMAVIGIVERGGRVVAKPADPGEVSIRGLTKFITRFVDAAGSLLMTDQFPGHQGMATLMHHAVINHTKSYADGLTHTNSIEGFWGLVKRAWYGQHHHYSRKYASLYIAEACYKYNYRKSADTFDGSLRMLVGASA